MTRCTKTIAIFGSAVVAPDSPQAAQAYQAGYQLALAGFAICNGGYGGVMEAASRGAHDAQGQVIGVTSGAFRHRTPNPYLTQMIETTDLLERITTLMRLADGYVVLDGGIGTLAELFVAWNLAATGWHKPVVVVGDALKNALSQITPYTEIGEGQMKLLHFQPSVEDMLRCLRDHLIV
ncbi:MAG: LOG family protein [bacterium]|jgi:uncharacterized protein (TIGR00730 family)|nr:LOG family protein [bacterium]